jgi:hypothetical protein
MKNPWLSLPKKPLFVLSCDRHAILSFNRTARDEYRVHNEELPEPYTGNTSANIVLLNLNPGFYERNEVFHQNDSFVSFAKMHRANLFHEYLEYPFYHLDPKNSQSQAIIGGVENLNNS